MRNDTNDDDNVINMPAAIPFGSTSIEEKLLNALLSNPSNNAVQDKVKQFLEDTRELTEEQLQPTIPLLVNFSALLKKNNETPKDKINQSTHKALYQKLLEQVTHNQNPLTALELTMRIEHIIYELITRHDFNAVPEPNTDLFEKEDFKLESEYLENQHQNQYENITARQLQWLFIHLNTKTEIDIKKWRELAFKIGYKINDSQDRLLALSLLLPKKPTEKNTTNFFSALSKLEHTFHLINPETIFQFKKHGFSSEEILEIFKKMEKGIPYTYMLYFNRKTSYNAYGFFIKILFDAGSQLSTERIDNLIDALSNEKTPENYYIEDIVKIDFTYNAIKSLGYTGIDLALFTNENLYDFEMRYLCYIAQRLQIKLTDNDSTILDDIDKLKSTLREKLSEKLIPTPDHITELDFTRVFNDGNSSYFSETHFAALADFLDTLHMAGYSGTAILKNLNTLVNYGANNNSNFKKIASIAKECINMIADRPLTEDQLKTIIENEFSNQGPTFPSNLKNVKLNFDTYAMLVNIKEHLQPKENYENTFEKMKSLFLIDKTDTAYQQQLAEMLSKLSANPLNKFQEILEETNRRNELSLIRENKKERIPIYILETTYSHLTNNETIKINREPIKTFEARVSEALENIHQDCNKVADLENHPIFKLIAYLPDNIKQNLNTSIEKAKKTTLVKEMKNTYKSDAFGGSSFRADAIFGKDNALKDIHTVASTLQERSMRQPSRFQFWKKSTREGASNKTVQAYQTQLNPYLNARANDTPQPTKH